MKSSIKRDRDADEEAIPGGGASTTNFRNVSACNRCRNRKNRCDQRLPRCSGCEKANVRCVGFDPVSKREIPRSYVYYLETRVSNLERILQTHQIACPLPSEDFAISDAIRPGINVPFPVQDDASAAAAAAADDGDAKTAAGAIDPALMRQHDRLVSNLGMVSVQGASDPRHMGPTSGIPFSRVVFAAVKSAVPSPAAAAKAASTKEKQQQQQQPSTAGCDSFFGLNTKPNVKPAPFPERETGARLVDLYFEYANPQIPILHRGEFGAVFERVYATEARKRRPRELYLLNIVFAIGSGIIMDSTHARQSTGGGGGWTTDDPAPNRKRLKVSGDSQPEEYHASAIMHLDSFMGSAPAAEGVGGGLEELQAVLLLAGLAVLRPVAPGLWYIIGVAVRLAVDLGLHFEDVDVDLDNVTNFSQEGALLSKAVGKKQWARDLRRRLWWCTYAFDRLVSTCVGRPVGISDQAITTEFPSLLDDRYITSLGFLKPPSMTETPSYKLVAHHYFRLRLLQSEILQVLQHRQAEQARVLGVNRDNEYIHTKLQSPFLQNFKSFRDWRADVDRRLWGWKESAPEQSQTGVAFTPLLLELNYWQAIIMLYRQSLTVPEPLAGELSPSTGGDMHSPSTNDPEEKEDEEMVYMKVAQAGQTTLKIYRQLHRLKLVNYTFLATHHLFMSGISFLYAIWHSTLVRSQLTLDDVDFTVLIATSVLTDLIDKCPPAEACRDAFMRMSKATISMCLSTTGFGNLSTLGSQPLNSPGGYFHRGDEGPGSSGGGVQYGVGMPQLHFSAEEIATPQQQGLDPFSFPTTASSYSTTTTTTNNNNNQPSTSSISPLPHQQSASYPTLAPSQPDFSFDDLGFLETFPMAEPNQNDWDLGFGTGGTGIEWDVFDGFFFGNGGGAAGGG